MSPKATVIVIAATGNVLGLVTHEGDPERALSAEAVAGAAFPVRDGQTGDVIVDVPVAELGTSAVPVVDVLLKTPQRCVVADGAATTGASVTSLDLSNSEITVKVPTAPQEDLEVRVFVEHGQGSDRKRAVFQGTLASSATEVEIKASFDSDVYDLVAAVPGHALTAKAAVQI
jgi:hypothetical protein